MKILNFLFNRQIKERAAALNLSIELNSAKTIQFTEMGWVGSWSSILGLEPDSPDLFFTVTCCAGSAVENDLVLAELTTEENI